MSHRSEFKPLTMINVLWADTSLTPNQRYVLLAAVSRTDNGTGRVRASQERLAAMTGLHVRTVQRVLKVVQDRYFTAERMGRQINLTWATRDTVPETTPGTESGFAAHDARQSVDEGRHSSPDTRHCVPETRHGAAPSDGTSASSSVLTSKRRPTITTKKPLDAAEVRRAAVHHHRKVSPIPGFEVDALWDRYSWLDSGEVGREQLDEYLTSHPGAARELLREISESAITPDEGTHGK